MGPISFRLAAAALAIGAFGGMPMLAEERDTSPKNLYRRFPTVRGHRNALCVCGSGRKFKKCCIGKPLIERKDGE